MDGPLDLADLMPEAPESLKVSCFPPNKRSSITREGGDVHATAFSALAHHWVVLDPGMEFTLFPDQGGHREPCIEVHNDTGELVQVFIGPHRIQQLSVWLDGERKRREA